MSGSGYDSDDNFPAELLEAAGKLEELEPDEQDVADNLGQQGWKENHDGSFTGPDGINWRLYPPRIAKEKPFEPLRKPGIHTIDGKKIKGMCAGELVSRFLADGSEMVISNTNIYGKELFGEKWKAIGEQEFHDFLALLLMMGIVQKDQIKDYWTTDPLLETPGFRSVMSRDRFTMMWRSLRMNNNAEDEANGIGRKGDPKYDSLFKARRFMDSVFKKFREAYSPNRNICIDEQMVAFKGRFYWVVVMKGKPNPKGLKIFSVCESETGYNLGIHVYCGEKLSKHKDGGKGKTYAVYWYLLEEAELLDQGFNTWNDNYYTYVDLYRDLLERKTYCAGTLKHAKDMPKKLINQLTQHLMQKTTPRGSSAHIHTADLTVTLWKDRRIVRVLNAMPHIVGEGGSCERNILVEAERQAGDAPNKKRVKYEKGSVAQPSILAWYNKFMGGVDHADQLLGASFRDFRLYRWYMSLFLYTINTAICNAYVINREQMSLQDKKRYQLRNTRLDVRDYFLRISHCGYKVVQKELASASSFVIPVKKKKEAPERLNPDLDHKQFRVPNKRKECKGHLQRKDTNLYCSSCRIDGEPVALCKMCFARYHSEQNYLFDDPDLRKEAYKHKKTILQQKYAEDAVSMYKRLQQLKPAIEKLTATEAEVIEYITGKAQLSSQFL